MQETLTNFPKIECPFIRDYEKVDEKVARQLKSHRKTLYLATNEINPGYEWVFDDPDTIAIEKLDGTNVKLKTLGDRLITVQNRKNVVDVLKIVKNEHKIIINAVFKAAGKKYIKGNSIQAGEVIGPKVQSNPYDLETPVWYPFDKAIGELKYNFLSVPERTYDNLSKWFQFELKSILYKKIHPNEDPVFSEGIVFYNLNRKQNDKTYMAKLRRDMFLWYYK